MSAEDNFRIQDLAGINIGTNSFPDGPAVLGGIPFNRPSGGLNAWGGNIGDYSSQRSVDIPVGVYGVSSVYTLINSVWGQPGPQSYATLWFYGSKGAQYQLPLIGGVDFRDWQDGSYVNTINGTSTTNVFMYSPPNGMESVRLDMQTVALPPEFSTQVLTDVVLVDSGLGGATLNGTTYTELGNGFQRVFMTGLTVASVPEPSTLTLAALGGLALLASRLRRRIQSAA